MASLIISTIYYDVQYENDDMPFRMQICQTPWILSLIKPSAIDDKIKPIQSEIIKLWIKK